MNIYVRRNMVKQWWEMCIETNRNDWQPVFDREKNDFMEIMNPEVVKTDARLLWGVVDDCSILMAPPVREYENTHRYYD